MPLPIPAPINVFTYRRQLRKMINSFGFLLQIQETGIAPEKLHLIWDRYYKVDKVHKRAAVGTGLGLSIVRSTMDLLGGSYGVSSSLGNGSTFWFEIKYETN